jgi:hypothetical protein
LDALTLGRRKYRNPPQTEAHFISARECDLNNRPNKTSRDRDAPARTMPTYSSAHRDDPIAFAATLVRRLLRLTSWLTGSRSFNPTN